MPIPSMPKFVSLYSGASGLDLGFIAAGFEPIFANDINADATATYKAAMKLISQNINLNCSHEVVTGDIRQVENLPARGSADLVIGGPPCQGFSVAGKMDPNDPRSRHVFDFLGMVERVQPKAFVMENVKALAENKRWAGTIADIRKKAEEIGYTTHLKVLNSADYGVPQTRERMFLVGFKDPSIEYSYPEASVKKPLSVAEALRSLPSIGEAGNDEVCTAKITPAKKPILRQSPFAGMLFNGQVPSNLRRISVQEAAAIQTFPKDMPWHGSQSSRYRQIGNAVPPKLAYAVAQSVAKAMGLKTEKHLKVLERIS